jgi:hypothetical protein
MKGNRVTHTIVTSNKVKWREGPTEVELTGGQLRAVCVEPRQVGIHVPRLRSVCTIYSK